MKFLNDFKNLFAIVGVVSIIFWTCSAESTSDNTNVNPPQLTGGTYQVSLNSNAARMIAVNVETGVVETFEFEQEGNNYIWSQIINGLDALPLTLTH